MSCRLCTANDREALIEELAQGMWKACESQDDVTDYKEWDAAGIYWQHMFREYAEAFLDVLRQRMS